MLGKPLVKVAVLLVAALLCSTVAAHADLLISPAPNPLAVPPTDTFKAEPGQGIPTGTGGYHGGKLVLDTATTVIFTYLGFGNSINVNEFWVGPDRATAEAAGHFFCTKAGGSCSAASPVGASFSVDLTAGDIPFGFFYDQTEFGGPHSILNGGLDNGNGAYLSQIGLGTTANAGPGKVAYLGLSDEGYPSPDLDFQDLTVRVVAPEPATLLLLGLGLAGLGVAGWRRKPR